MDKDQSLNSRPAYRNDIDGLRAVAVLSVVLYHYKFTFLTGGFTGVDIFFVISGFVITKSIFTELQHGQFSIANFYFKRIRRIIPALFAIYIVTSIAAAIILLPRDFIAYSKSLISSASFVSNIFFWKSSGYFNPSAENQPLLHTWSLSVEEQYYVFMPLLFAFLDYLKIRRRTTIILLAVISIFSLVLSIAAVYTAPTAGFFLLPTRLWELLIGAMLGIYSLRENVFFRGVVNSLFSLAGMALIAFGLLTIDSGDPFPGWNALFPCVGAALIILGGTTERPPLVNQLLATPLPVGIGKISYSLYLIHWPVVAFANYYIDGVLSTYVYFMMIIIVIGASYLSWKYIEQPFRHLSYNRMKAAFFSTGFGVAVFCAAGVSVIVSGGFPQRHPGFVEQKIAGLEDWGGNACFHQNATTLETWDPKSCQRTTGSGGNVLLWGDSFAAHYLPGLLMNSAIMNRNIFQYTFAGCPPVLSYYSLARPACTTFNAQALPLLKTYKIDTVILSARWSDVPKATLEQLHETIAEINRWGAAVIVIGPSPQFSVDVQRLDYLAGASSLSGEVSGKAVNNEDIAKKVADQATGAKFIDPMASLCVSDRCTYRVNTNYLYADYGHFSGFGADLAVRAFLMPLFKSGGTR